MDKEAMNKKWFGKYVIVESEQGALIGGVFSGMARNGNLFLMKHEICLEVDAIYKNNWESLPKLEPWCGPGKIVDDPRKKQDFKPPDCAKNQPGDWERLSLEDIKRK